ncbi:MAG: tRNA uridine-5-carboxymethylaminomethyl(34) synthesis enzyme MnmG [Tidjanibacter sp.]|nr:tRNA uridine-5-carboxymethylaminomethyl(34) synthesis enzyme MnmG [Tidjanibacter sp.]
MKLEYDIIVVGGGHAGCEAAAAAAKLGRKTLLITMDMTKYASMSCNPAIGGVAKGQIVREIDALGGQMGIVTDRTTIQFRMLNRSKGAAMWSPRAQCDKAAFSAEWRKILENTDNLNLWQDTVNQLIISNIEGENKVCGVRTMMGIEFSAKAVILTNGTFLGGLMHIGRNNAGGGRAGDSASYGITEQLVELGFEAGRMKTGTPARLDARSIDFSVMEPQKGDENPSKFSFLPSTKAVENQLPCYLVYTSKEVHDTLRTGFEDSPLFTGIIQGIGPRYCPSIEDKLRTFAGKDFHQLFLEPEGRETNEYYLNGFSSSLPWQVQMEALRKIKGFENVNIYRTGYAIEYDYFPPTQLHHTLETKLVQNLYFAGQINGTTGYEEAAAQGLVAGINAARKISGENEFILNRDEAYIGVLIDDLVTKGVDEPYRMFTSRAEYRILLRQDDADMRLTPIAEKLGMATDERIKSFNEKKEKINLLKNFVLNTSIDKEEANKYLETINSTPITQKKRIGELLSRNEVTIKGLSEYSESIKNFVTENQISEEVIEAIEIEQKYKGYIEREKEVADKLKRLENIIIPDNFDFNSMQSLTIEARQKLTRIQPKTIGQASRIPGVSPADINVLLIFFGR